MRQRLTSKALAFTLCVQLTCPAALLEALAAPQGTLPAAPLKDADLNGTWLRSDGAAVSITQDGEEVSATIGPLLFRGDVRNGRLSLEFRFDRVEEMPSSFDASMRPKLVGKVFRLTGIVADQNALDLQFFGWELNPGTGEVRESAPAVVKLTRAPMDEPETWYPEHPYRPTEAVLRVETFLPGRIPEATWRALMGEELAAGWGRDDRLLAVYGLNLFEDGRPATVDSEDPEVTYTMVDTTPEDPSAGFTRRHERLWASVAARVSALDSAAVMDALRVADIALVKVHFRPGVTAGLKTFRINFAPVEWLEETGNVTADVDFVRQIGPDEAEPLETIFLHDRFRVRAVVNTRTALDELECVVFKNEQPWAIGGKRTLRLYRSDYDPRVYHSDIIRVTPAPGVPGVSGVIDEPIAMKSRLTAMIPRLAPVKIRRPAAAHVEVTPDAVQALWKDWLFRAAALAGRPLTDYAKLDEESLGALLHVQLTGNQKIPIQLGDYAAMLMLRRAYLRLLTPVRDEFQKLRDGARNDVETLQSFYELARVAMADPDNPMARIPVKECCGGVLRGTVPFSRAYDSAYVRELRELGTTADRQQQWVTEATREALEYYVAALELAVATAEKVDERNIRKLLELTGIGFTQVVERLRPNMLRLREGPEGFTWEVDPIARTRLSGVRSIAAEHIANHELSKAESDVVLTAASLIFVAPNTVLLRTLSLAMAITFAEKAFLVDLPTYFRGKADLSFATGAYAVLGPERMAIAEARQVSGVMTAISVIGSTVGLGGEFWRFVQTIRQADAMAAVPGMVGRLKDGNLYEFTRLTTQERGAYAAVLGEARLVQARRAADLTSFQREILSVDRLLDPRLRFLERWRATRVDAAVRDRILKRAALSEPAPPAPQPGPAAPRPGPRPRVPAQPPSGPDAATVATRAELIPPHKLEIPRGFPGENGGVFALPGGQTITVGRRLGVGVHAVVYELDPADAARLANWLRPGEKLPPGEMVVKLMKEAGDHGRLLVQRQQAVQELLTKHGINNLRLVGGSASGPNAFVVQQRIPPGSRTFGYQAARRPATDWGIPKVEVDLYAYLRGGPLPRELQEALLRLFRNIADKQLIWEDGHLGNIYFHRNGNAWEAGVLDHERFIPWAHDVNDELFGVYEGIHLAEGSPTIAYPGVPGFKPARIHSLERTLLPPNTTELLGEGKHVWPSSQFFMAKMLEYDGRYIRFNSSTGQWMGKHLDLDLVRKYFPDFERYNVVPQ